MDHTNSDSCNCQAITYLQRQYQCARNELHGPPSDSSPNYTVVHNSGGCVVTRNSVSAEYHTPRAMTAKAIAEEWFGEQWSGYGHTSACGNCVRLSLSTSKAASCPAGSRTSARDSKLSFALSMARSRCSPVSNLWLMRGSCNIQGMTMLKVLS